MDKQDIKLSDLYRILFGEAPVEFLLEVGMRTIIIYLCLLIIIRLMGKRMGGELSISETAVTITLGAIISAPMQIPDRGIIQGAVILICALIFQRGLNYLGVTSKKAEAVLYGKETLLVKNGVLQLKAFSKENISKQQVYANLRNKSIYNLGQVERMYLEAGGLFSVFCYDTPRSGLSILPVNDKKVQQIQQQQEGEDFFVCQSCGLMVKRQETNYRCSNCSHKEWIKAIR